MNQVDKIMAYEQGELDEDGVIELFSELIKSGTINHLQGSYGRTAHHLISTGVLSAEGDIL